MYPWLVALIKGSSRLFCGGSLLSSTYVLTAAHCVVNMKKSDFRVNAHEHNLLKYDGEVEYYVKTIYIHPLFANPGNQDYSYANGDGDFALLQLESPVIKKGQRYICLPSPGNRYTSTQAITAGWGLDETGRTPDIPRHVGLVTITNQECQGKMVRTITDNMICANGQEEYASACPGDSGSPLMVGETIIGVASIAQGCKPIIKGRPTVFARVTSQLTWIKKYVTNACTG